MSTDMVRPEPTGRTMPKHREATDCPCAPERRQAVGGGHVMVHRRMDLREGRETPSNRALDRLCSLCGDAHVVGHEHLQRMTDIRAGFRPDYLRSEENDRTVAFLR